MLTLVALLWRHPDLDHAGFVRHWHDVHGPLMREPTLARHLLGYEQLPALAAAQGFGGMADCDGVTLQRFRDFDGFCAFIAEPAYRDTVRPDELRLLDTSRTVWFVSAPGVDVLGA